MELLQCWNVCTHGWPLRNKLWMIKTFLRKFEDANIVYGEILRRKEKTVHCSFTGRSIRLFCVCVFFASAIINLSIQPEFLNKFTAQIEKTIKSLICFHSYSNITAALTPNLIWFFYKKWAAEEIAFRTKWGGNVKRDGLTRNAEKFLL